AGVRWRVDARQNQGCDQVRLIQHVYMRVSRQIASVADVAEACVEGDVLSGRPAILDQLEFADRGNEFVADPGKKRLVLLAKRLNAEKGRLDHELRDVGSLRIAVARYELAAEQVLRRDRKGD